MTGEYTKADNRNVELVKSSSIIGNVISCPGMSQAYIKYMSQ